MLALLPARKAAHSQKRPGADSLARSPGHAAQGRALPRRVLLVEDNLDTVRSLALLLREMGHEVEYAINGYAALDAARRFKPDFVLLDLGLPGMDGFELCRRLKRDIALAGARVIAITGYGHDDYRRRALEAGCELHLLKPVPTEVLEALLG